MGRTGVTEEQLNEWISAAERIQSNFGTQRAIGYLIGEKFYHIAHILHSSRKMIRAIDDERRNPGYRPVVETVYKGGKLTANLDEIYEQEKEIIIEAEGLLVKFAGSIKDVFAFTSIKSYFDSNPRLGSLGHAATEQEYDYLVGTGAVEHSIDTEVEDALIFGTMMKYFGIS